MSVDERSWVLVAQLPLSAPVESLVAELQRLAIGHRIVIDNQRQSLWVENPEHITQVAQLVKELVKPQRQMPQDPCSQDPFSQDPWSQDSWPQNPGSQRTRSKGTSGPWRFGSAYPKNGSHISRAKILLLLRRFPVTVTAILLSLLGALLVVQQSTMVYWLLFPQQEQWSLVTFWRWLTPVFLHSSLSHVVFNCLWVWVFGSRLEQVHGSGKLFVLIVVTGLGGNIAQYLWDSITPFGGMSGVVYGLLGYILVRQKYSPHPLLVFPPMLFGMMLIFLVLGITGTISQLSGVSIANASHLGGLLSGVAMALITALRQRR